MANPIACVIHRATTWSIVLSVLMIAAGVLAIVSPVVAGVAVTVIFGCSRAPGGCSLTAS